MKKLLEQILHYQTLYVVWGNMLLMIFLLAYLQWTWWLPLLIIASYYIFTAISEVTVHRYFSHKSYEVSNFGEKVLLFLALFVGQGSIIHWVAVHRQHHAFEDTPKDPHSPLFVPLWRLFLGIFPKLEYRPSIVADLLRGPHKDYILFEKKYYILLWTAIWIISWLISPWLMLFIVGGSVSWFLGTALINWVGHNSNNEKRFSNAVGFNSSWLNFVTGAGNHNNHHARPHSHSFTVDKEIDVYGWLIERYAKSVKVPR